MLLGAALLSTPRPREWRLVAGVLLWTLKPQLAVAYLLYLLVTRRWRALAALGVLLAALSCVAVVVTGPGAVQDYVRLAQTKQAEVLWNVGGNALPGPTVLDLGEWAFGFTWSAIALTVAGDCCLAVALIVAWGRGARGNGGWLLGSAILPLLAVLCAPYALVGELTSWLAPVCLFATYAGRLAPTLSTTQDERRAVRWPVSFPE